MLVCFFISFATQALYEEVDYVALAFIFFGIAVPVILFAMEPFYTVLEMDRNKGLFSIQRTFVFGMKTITRPLNEFRSAHIQTSRRSGPKVHRILLAFYDGSAGDNIPLTMGYYNGSRMQKTAPVINDWYKKRIPK